MNAGPTNGEAEPRLSVVIVTTDTRQQVLDCLAALRSNPPTVPWEVVVVDNGSSDGTVDAVRTDAPWAMVIANPSNRGLPAANNQGIAGTRGEFILIANADTTVKPGALDAMIRTLEEHDRAVFAIPRMLHPDGTLQTSAGDLPTLREALLGRQAQRRGNADTGFWWDGWPHDEARQIGRGHEACYLARRRAIAEVGVQDEEFALDWEGIDWTERARTLGWEVWFNPEAEIVHYGGATHRQAPFRWIVHSHRAMYRYFAKRRPPAARPFIAFLFAMRALVKAGAYALGPEGPVSYDRANRGSPG